MATSAVNINLVRTRLDELLVSKMEPNRSVGVVNVDNPFVFNQKRTNIGYHTQEVLAGSGAWGETGETAQLDTGISKSTNQTSTRIAKYSKAEEFPMEYFDDHMFDAVAQAVMIMARNGQRKRNEVGFGVYANGFSSQTTPDALSLFNNSHTLINSAQTEDNLRTAKLNEPELEDLIKGLTEQRTHDGLPSEYNPRFLLVAPDGFKRACEIVESDGKSQTANNDLNIYSYKYGIFVGHNPYIGTKYSGSDDYAILIGDEFYVDRIVRQDLQTSVIPFEVTNNQVLTYQAWYREAYATPDWHGVIATNGTTGSYA